MKTFYQYMMRYRGAKNTDKAYSLAEWMFYDHDFPKQSTDYDELSRYLEWTAPFPEALQTFDRLWDEYKINA
ncbi:uncharacterized protein YozE (UPF0346 family) [Saliterribacillus persicus]|uniref:UPF0346 protein DFR57_112146 n=2 Tax=Saliterribacillus persicus TaxID=930114 RepID=A0A368XER7_9BACI|nr:YozE family protein [Saliterribacillus persicus]RCW64967.1 uncharacterized protein YozE (UPF0346 family) [Saliterribacillus persicus]